MSDDAATHDRHLTSESEGSGSQALGAVAAINFLGFLVELVGGLAFGSVALISDALHMLFDVFAYVMAFSAAATAERFGGGDDWSYGLHRLEPVAAFLNGVLLVPMVGYIAWESFHRFLDPVSIDPAATLLVATGGLLINVGSVSVLQGGAMSLNERGAFYHLLGDAGGSVAVIVSTIVVAVWDVPVADPMTAVLIGLVVLWSAGRVLRESTSILLQRSPTSLESLESDLRAVDDVESVEDVHVWQVCSRFTVATVQVSDTAASLDAREAVRSRIRDVLSDRGIDHATIEVSASRPSADEARDRTRHGH